MTDQPVDKGKSRAAEVATSKEENSNKSSSNDDASLGSRILASATGLARDLTGVGNGALTASLADSAGSSAKTRPATQSGAAEKTSNALRNLGGSGVVSSSSAGASENFRSADADSTAAQDFEAFQQPSKLPSDVVAAQQLPQSYDTWASEFQIGSNHVQEYSAEDGLEVAQLLSDPYFVAMTDDAAPEPEQSADDAADLFGNDFSADEAKAAKAIKEDLPPPPIHQPIAADHPRNLVANFEALLAGHDTDAHANSSMIHFHNKEDQQQWYSQWSGVLTQYTDEVWGDMLPIVREEQKHAEAIKQGKESVDSKSVQRLNMILGHVEQYRHWRG